MDYITEKEMNSDIKLFTDKVKIELERYYGDEYRILVHDITKNNDRRLTGIIIVKGQDDILPMIYLELYYIQYKNGRSIGDICNDIIKVYDDSKDFITPEMKKIGDSIAYFRNVERMICYRLANAGMNDSLLRKCPHRMMLDLAIFYYIPIINGSKQNYQASVTVTNKMMELWGIDEEMLHTLAAKNTPILMSGRIDPIQDYIGEEVPDLDVLDIWIASNSHQKYGAAIILNKDMMCRFARKLCSDFYIIPLSVNEVLLVSGQDDNEAVKMAKEANTIWQNQEEMLSDHAYRYDWHTEEIRIVG